MIGVPKGGYFKFMRINTPVTAVEHEVREEAPIVSKTDTKGHIVYINAAFLEISGFTEEELLGQPHNIVRHPEMPPEAFADMWASLKAGRPWTGMVKNRCKNGDFYWVVANVTPIWKDGVLDGYMSVRTKPDRPRIVEAEAAYRALREKRVRGLAVVDGVAVRTGLLYRCARLLDLSLDWQAAFFLGGLALILAGVGVDALRRGSVAGLAVAAVGMVLVAGFWWTLLRQTARPLREATFVARRIAGGDLSSCGQNGRGGGSGECGQLLQALRQMSVNLQAMVGDIGMSVEAMNLATQRMAVANAELSDRTSAQAAGLEETAASLEEVSSAVELNADRSAEADRIALAAAGEAARSGEVFARVGTTMGQIHASSSKIAAITKVIDGIAFQTNILALNASVEAARAGEHGAGFAVVAEEVRSLAQRSAAAAKDIEALISEASSTVDSGNTLVGELSGTMERLLGSVRQVPEVVGQIASASKEQSAGIAQINKAVSDMDKMTQENAAMSVESLQDTKHLEEQVRQLAEAVSVFRFRTRENRSSGGGAGRHASVSSPLRMERNGGSRMSASPIASRKIPLPVARKTGAFVGE